MSLARYTERYGKKGLEELQEKHRKELERLEGLLKDQEGRLPTFEEAAAKFPSNGVIQRDLLVTQQTIEALEAYIESTKAQLVEIEASVEAEKVAK